MTPFAGVGGKRSPLARHSLTRLLLAEGQLCHLRPIRGLELLHPHPLLQAQPQGPCLVVGQVVLGPGPSFH